MANRQEKLKICKETLAEIMEIIECQIYEGIETGSDAHHLEKPALQLIDEAIELYKTTMMEGDK